MYPSLGCESAIYCEPLKIKDKSMFPVFAGLTDILSGPESRMNKDVVLTA